MNCIVDNIAVQYQTQGDGPVVLLLHGWGASLQDLWPLAEALSVDHKVIALDLPGFGASELPTSDWYVGDYVHFVQHFLEKLQIDSLFCIIGHSFGGRIAIKGLGTHALFASRLILIGSAGIKHSDTPKNTLLKVVAKTGKAILSLPGLKQLSAPAQKKLYKAIGSTDYLQAGPLQQILIHTVEEDLSQYAKRITLPTLLVWGELDDQAPLSDGKVLHEAISGSVLKSVSEAGHFVHHDASATVTTWIKEFLSR